MKKVTAVLVALIILALSTGTFAFQNEPDGFRGLKWGDSPAEDMKYFDTIEGNERYILSEEDNSFGDIELEQLFYVFCGDPSRLFYVMLSFKGKPTYERLQTFCRQEYGEENAEGSDGSPCWGGGDAIISFDYDTEKEEGSVVFSNVSMLTEIIMTEIQKESRKTEQSE